MIGEAESVLMRKRNDHEGAVRTFNMILIVDFRAANFLKN